MSSCRATNAKDSPQAGTGDAMSTKPYRPISAAEGDFFIAAQCGNCTKQDGCRIVLLTMVRSEDDPKYPKEWVSDADGNNPRCTAREVTLATVLAEDMVPTDREEPGSVTFTAAEVEHLRGLVRLRAAAQRVVKERDALRTECDDLRRVFSLVHGSLGIQQGEHIGNAIDALKKERDELATRLRQSIARGDFAEMRLATLAAELETERERHRQTAGLEWPLSCVEVVKGGDK